MAVLESHHKKFIIKQLACYKPPSEVISEVKDRYDLKLTSNQIAYYDPQNNSGRKLAKKWTNLFHSAREQFEKGAFSSPIGMKEFRLRELEDLYYKFKRAGNYMMAARMLKQAQEEQEGLQDPSGGGKGDTYYTQIVNNMVDRLR